MLKLPLATAQKLLFLGAHSDDIEIGCGGTILELAANNSQLEIVWVVFSADGKRRQEARSSARVFLKGVGHTKVIVHSFKGSFFPVQAEAIKRSFEKLKGHFDPDMVFTHYREDRHQDHRLLSDLTWNTFRDHLILEYEIPKYDGDLGNPNLFLPLDESACRRKVQQLCRMFGTQRNKHWFSEDTFLALMRLRGIECASKYAEAFHCRKLVCDGS
ncbi:MAG TPA: PIG-L deacetylase family protein [Chthoniobacterales bacterium]